MSMVGDMMYENELEEIASAIKTERNYDYSSWDMALDNLALRLSRTRFSDNSKEFLKKCNYEVQK